MGKYDGFRLAVDSLQLKCMEGKTYNAYDLWLPAWKRLSRFHIRCVNGLRELGFSSTEILEHLKYHYFGVMYEYDVRLFNRQVKKAGLTRNWWESPSFKKAVEERQIDAYGKVLAPEEVEEKIQ